MKKKQIQIILLGIICTALAVWGTSIFAKPAYATENSISKASVSDKVTTKEYGSSTYTYHLPVLDGDSTGITTINAFYQAQRKEQIKEFKSMITDDSDISFSDELTYKLTYNKNGYISILQSGYVYTGGAHGMPYRIAHTFDLNTGDEIALSDIFDLTESELTTKITRAFRKMMKADTDGGYWTAEFGGSAIKTVKRTAGFSSPFYLTKTGVCFYYDPYVLASYAKGFVEATLRFSANKDLIKIEALTQ